MNEMLIIFLAIVIVISCSLLFHWIVRSYFWASVASALTASLILQLLSYLEAGYLDKFYIIGFVVGAAVSLLISLVVGIPFRDYRQRRAGQQQ